MVRNLSRLELVPSVRGRILFQVSHKVKAEITNSLFGISRTEAEQCEVKKSVRFHPFRRDVNARSVVRNIRHDCAQKDEAARAADSLLL